MINGEWGRLFLDCDVTFSNSDLIFITFALKIANVALVFRTTLAPCQKINWQSYFGVIFAIFFPSFSPFSKNDTINTLLRKQKNIAVKFIM